MPLLQSSWPRHRRQRPLLVGRMKGLAPWHRKTELTCLSVLSLFLRAQKYNLGEYGESKEEERESLDESVVFIGGLPRRLAIASQPQPCVEEDG